MISFRILILKFNRLTKMKAIIFHFILFLPFFLHAQDKNVNTKLIDQHFSGELQRTNSLNTQTPLQTKHRSFFAKYNPVTLTLSGLMLFYQHVVSQQISAECIYSRSCSNFAKQAINEFGIIKGVCLAADRLMRCNRPCENDFPSYSFNSNGKITDEPKDYRIIK